MNSAPALRPTVRRLLSLLFVLASWVPSAKAGPDGDGLSNVIEYVLGGNPKSVMDVSVLPTQALVTEYATDYLKFTYRQTQDSSDGGAIAVCQYGTDLGATPWTNTQHGIFIFRKNCSPQPVMARQKTFLDGWIPIVQYDWQTEGIHDAAEMFSARTIGWRSAILKKPFLDPYIR